MNTFPDWLVRIKKTLPHWIDEISHSDGPGRFRFALEAYEPYDLDSSHLLHNIIFSTADAGRGLPSEEERRQWIDYLCGLQRAEDGLLIDPGMERHIISKGLTPTEEETANVRRFTSRNGLCTVIELGGKPRYPLRHNEVFRQPEEIIHYLESLPWENPWGAGSWAGAIILFQHFNRLLGDEKADELIQVAANWLVKKQNPKTGAWSNGSDVPLHCLINGIFKVWIQVIPVSDMPVQYPEQVIDLCIKGMREDTALKDMPDTCSIFDVALVLDIALRFTDHRRNEVAELAKAALPQLEPMVRPDGAFSYGQEHSLADHGGLNLAPVKNQSDATGTALMCNTIPLLCNLCGLREELGWTPLTEWRMGLK
ncbi:MAG: hypothetical protein Q7J98_14620 [Kiritimatiellia bacterium]|nr:hypothetical protein [Kiritimatiellia bacterium]